MCMCSLMWKRRTVLGTGGFHHPRRRCGGVSRVRHHARRAGGAATAHPGGTVAVDAMSQITSTPSHTPGGGGPAGGPAAVRHPQARCGGKRNQTTAPCLARQGPSPERDPPSGQAPHSHPEADHAPATRTSHSSCQATFPRLACCQIRRAISSSGSRASTCSRWARSTTQAIDSDRPGGIAAPPR